MIERPRDLGIAVERAARLEPHRPAVSDRHEDLTYGELLERARGLAASLPTPAGDGRRRAVAMLMPHRASAVVAMLGALLAGRPYCLINPAQPTRRLETLLEAIEPEVIWAPDPGLRRRLAEAGLGPMDPSGGPRPAPATNGGECPPGEVCALYLTSGSSGAPRAVRYVHGATLHRAALYAEAIGATHRDRFSLVSPLWTAAASSAAFTALSTGASLRVLEPAGLAPDALRDEVAEAGITVWHSIPSLFRRLAGAGLLGGNRFRVVRLGGEPLLETDVELARRICREGTLLVTGYSLTEANGAVTQKAVPLREANAVTLADAGRPVAGVELVIASRDGGELPPGREGEIVVVGDRLSAGYAGPDDGPGGTRFTRRNGTLRLHTGDRGVLRADGSLEVRGREDGRVKVHGHRVDQNEVMAAALAHGDVLDAVVVPFAPRGGDGTALALLALPKEGHERLAAASLRTHLEARIAPEAVPAVIRVVDRLPLTPSGKVDRVRLVSLLERGEAGEQPGARSPLIGELLRAWAEALEIDDLSPDEDFFELGGDSLAAAEVSAAVESTHGVPMEPAVLLRHRTVNALGRYLESLLSGASAGAAKVVSLNAAGGEPPLFVIPGAGSDASALVHFAEAIGPEQPVEVIQLPGADGRSRPLIRMDRIAEHCLAAIDEAAGRPPFRIAGTSFGGLVAYLLASELVRRGREVEYLGLFDTPAPETRRRHHLTDPLHRMGLAWRPSVRRLRADPRAELRRLGLLLRNLVIDYLMTASLLLGLDSQPPVEWRFRRLMAGCFIAVRGWTPPRLSIPIHLYRCETQPRYLAGAPLLGWERHASGVVVRAVRSRHGRHIRPPAVGQLAELVSEDLWRCRERQPSA